MENQSEKLDHQVAGLPSLYLASSRIQFSVHTGSGRRHSGLILPARTTLAHFSISSTISFPQSAGEPGSVHAPISASRALSFGSASPALISWFNLSTMSAGVFLGAHTPFHVLASYPVTKSPMVGRSGSASERVAVVTARARSLPALMCGMDGCRLSKATWTCPARRSVSMGAEPRYGTCCMLTPVISLNSSPDIWIDVPVPDDAMLILPGLALA